MLTKKFGSFILILVYETYFAKGLLYNMKTPIGSGVITNYNCNAECRHCMFASSPKCEKNYISREMSEKVADILERSGALGVHIGGGEPFLDFDGLCGLVSALSRHGIGIDYIETNGFWAADEDAARRKLIVLKKLGVSTIMVSVDPFHIEFVPLERPLKLCALLEEEGFDYFIWQQKFVARLMKLDITKTHKKQELMEVLGEDYITDTAREYGLGVNGRALSFAEKLYGKKPYEVFVTEDKCPSLTTPNHCHIDLYGNAVPSRCTGICADAEDYLNLDTPKEKYPVLASLISGGTKGLFEYASSLGFIPDKEGYPTRCAFCFAMREYLERTHPSKDLSDKDFYSCMRKAFMQ